MLYVSRSDLLQKTNYKVIHGYKGSTRDNPVITFTNMLSLVLVGGWSSYRTKLVTITNQNKSVVQVKSDTQSYSSPTRGLLWAGRLFLWPPCHRVRQTASISPEAQNVKIFQSADVKAQKFSGLTA